MADDDPALPKVFTRTDASAAGLSRHQVQSRLGTRWVVLRRGVCCLKSTWDGASPVGRHLLSAAALVTACRSDDALTLSHLTAAAVWGLPLPLGETWPIEATTRPGRRTPERDGRTRIHVATLRPQDRVRVCGVWVTTPHRTVADCLRHGGPTIGVPIGDAALLRQLTTEPELDEVLAFQSSWPYAARAARGRPWLAPRESWLESSSFVVLAASGVPLPGSQLEIFDELGAFVARVDFAWMTDGVVGEADGQGKYGLGRYAGENGPGELVDVDAVRRALQEERQRQQRLEDLDLRVVRWDTAIVLTGGQDLVRRIERARHGRRSNPFRGSFRPAALRPTLTPRVHPEMPHITPPKRRSSCNPADEVYADVAETLAGLGTC